VNVAARVVRSLWRDLVLPWIVSAICIATFLGAVLLFGLWIWPAAFIAFIFLCRANDQARKIAAAAARDPESPC
jgi:hypothetical protein